MHASTLADLQWEFAAWDAFGDPAESHDAVACRQSDREASSELVQAIELVSPA